VQAAASRRGTDAQPTPPPPVPLPQAVAELEARAIRQALQRTGGNKLAAARLLGISRATLYLKLPLVGAAEAAPHNAVQPVGD
jgi:DNA-binding NtrC family response regulator